VKEYQEGRYRYGKNDLPFLFNTQSEVQLRTQDAQQTNVIGRKIKANKKETPKFDKGEDADQINLTKIDDLFDEIDDFGETTR
jgi:hypothetical protein